MTVSEQHTLKDFPARNRRQAMRLLDEALDIACDLQEGAKFTEKKQKRLGEINLKLRVLRAEK